MWSKKHLKRHSYLPSSSSIVTTAESGELVIANCELDGSMNKATVNNSSGSTLSSSIIEILTICSAVDEKMRRSVVAS